MVSEDGQNAFAKAGATNPPIRKDMADPKTNLWGQGVNGEYKDLNMEAYTYKVEYNQPTDFFFGLCAEKADRTDRQSFGSRHELSCKARHGAGSGARAVRRGDQSDHQ